jgi:uncharacterized membrane protein (DUF485 family)
MLVYWWVIVLVCAGLGGNGYLIIASLSTGNVIGLVVFTICFIGACVYCYRTWRALDEIRGILKD